MLFLLSMGMYDHKYTAARKSPKASNYVLYSEYKE